MSTSYRIRTLAVAAVLSLCGGLLTAQQDKPEDANEGEKNMSRPAFENSRGMNIR